LPDYPSILHISGIAIIDVAQAGAISLLRREQGECLSRDPLSAACDDAQEGRSADEDLPRMRKVVRVATEMDARLGERALLLEEMRRPARFRREGGTGRVIVQR